MADNEPIIISWADFKKAALSDHTLTPEERRALEAQMDHKDFQSKLLYGTYGAGLAYLVSKYMKLSDKSMLLMSGVGFGVGRLLADTILHRDKSKDFAQYNKKTNQYEVR